MASFLPYYYDFCLAVYLYSTQGWMADGWAACKANAGGHSCCWQKGSNGVNICVLHVCGRLLSLDSAEHGLIVPVTLPEAIMKLTKWRLATFLVRAHPFTSVVLEGSALVKHIAFRSRKFNSLMWVFQNPSNKLGSKLECSRQRQTEKKLFFC